jgi:enoyl-[acyl-carrier protein] reductase/trans-2-enoyl-CoA reductase (NAD+)
MIIEPRIRGFICMTAHPDGCAAHVDQQIATVAAGGTFAGAKRALVVGASTGYGLASRTTATFGMGADTIGVFFERPASGKRTASAGWYNSAAFERRAAAAGRGAWSINGDAFSDEIKQQTIEMVRQRLGSVDLLVYSVAAPRRVDPNSGATFSSVLKPIGQPFHGRTVDPLTGNISEVEVEPATEAEIAATVAVMGGEDWRLWTEALADAGVLEAGHSNVAYSYIGPVYTHEIYRNGTIGRAKADLEATAEQLDAAMPGRTMVAINKALVTQSSAAIPVLPLYIMLLFQVMKEQGSHEDCAQQMRRLFAEHVYPGATAGSPGTRPRIDDLEMAAVVQDEVARRWESVTEANLRQLADFDGYDEEFLRLFGFGLPGVDYTADTNAEVAIPSLADLDLAR